MSISDHTYTERKYTPGSDLYEALSDPVYGDWARFLFPLQKEYMSGSRLRDLDLTWYSHINPETTAEILNTLRNRTLNGEKVFYDIYTDEEKQKDPEKNNTGLFFFKGNPGMPFALCNAGGGFAYVGAIHDSFPHALRLSQLGINAFALIYRPQAEKAYADLARAIAFVIDHAKELEVDVRGYSLWGGSAGARMAASLGALGTKAFGERDYPGPAAVIMQYTGFSKVYGTEPPTYCCVGTEDWVDYRVMEKRVRAIRADGTDAVIEVFPGLGHGFGLGEGTVAEGWLDNAVSFWLLHR